MKADTLITGISQLATATGPGPIRGRAMRAIRILEQAAIAVCAGKIAWVGKDADWTGDAREVIDLAGCAVIPGLVDPHTHAVWAGDRLNDFEARISGLGYETILAAGGGIRSTIRATAKTGRNEMEALAKPRLDALIGSGATTIEVKSGYGFEPAAEIKMLEAVKGLEAAVPARIVPTLLIHVPPENTAERAEYVSEMCNVLIPTVAAQKLAIALDVFVEQEAWSVSEAEQMLCAAKANGLAGKLHCDQFHSIGGVEMGLRQDVLSVDHLEASGPDQIERIAGSTTIATILPGVSLHLGIPAAPGRTLIDAGAAVAVGTDLNPGSSPLFSTAAAMAFAVRLNGLNAQEALTAGTVNAACALGLANVGCIEAGYAADFLVLHGRDWRELVYTLGGNPVRDVWISGRRIEQ